MYSLANAYCQQKEWDGAIIYCSMLLDAKVNHPDVNRYLKNPWRKRKNCSRRKKTEPSSKIYSPLSMTPKRRGERIHSEQEWQLERANKKGYVDEKTEILNFQAFKDFFPFLAGSNESSIFVGFLDINYFKFYNDFYGSHAMRGMWC